MITQAELKELFDYHPDGFLVWKKRTSNRVCVGDKAGSPGTYGYLSTRIYNKNYKNHRLIWCWHYGNLPSASIDHINGVTNDNRIENLREATHKQNCENLALAKTNTSGFRGVSWDKKKKKWNAYINHNQKRMHLGYFATTEEAAKVAAAKRAEIFTHDTGRDQVNTFA